MVMNYQNPGITGNQVAARLEAKLQQAMTLHQQGQLAHAKFLYEEILSIQAENFDALHLLGVIAVQTGNPGKAIELMTKAIALDPTVAAVYNNRGNALQGLKQLEAALQDYDKAIALQPDFAEAYNNRGVMLYELRHADAALPSYDKAISIRPDYAQAYNNRGNALFALNQFDAALASYDKALALQPDFAEAYCNRGNALKHCNQFEAALSSYNQAIDLRPNYENLFGMRLHTRMEICDWTNHASELAELARKIESRESASDPFRMLVLFDSLSLHRKSAEIYGRQKYPANHVLPRFAKLPRHQKIRVGYFSADFRDHPVSRLTAELYELHDRKRFEITAFSFGPDTKDDLRKRLEAGFDSFIDVRNVPDKEVALLSRNMEIDIAVDLGGFTRDSRTNIFAIRAGPIQMAYIGYLGTMGVEYIDYIVADQTIIPDESRQHYSEKVVYLPSYQVNDSRRTIADKEFSRLELGLPPTGFVFCCFNNSYKIAPQTFDGWIRILHQVEHSVLFIYADNDTAKSNLKKEARARGFDANRLIFGQRLSAPEYLARCRVADLFLDTLPYNGGTTASDALWAGLPVLTCMGESFPSRVAASLLKALHLPDLIATTQKQYESLAVEFATNPQRLSDIRQKLDKNKRTTPLFNSQLFTRHLEDAYTQMYERYQRDLPPEHIHVNG